jgi:hypothetical protein
MDITDFLLDLINHQPAQDQHQAVPAEAALLLFLSISGAENWPTFSSLRLNEVTQKSS